MYDEPHDYPKKYDVLNAEKLTACFTKRPNQPPCQPVIDLIYSDNGFTSLCSNGAWLAAWLDHTDPDLDHIVNLFIKPRTDSNKNTIQRYSLTDGAKIFGLGQSVNPTKIEHILIPLVGYAFTQRFLGLVINLKPNMPAKIAMLDETIADLNASIPDQALRNAYFLECLEPHCGFQLRGSDNDAHHTANLWQVLLSLILIEPYLIELVKQNLNDDKLCYQAWLESRAVYFGYGSAEDESYLD